MERNRCLANGREEAHRGKERIGESTYLWGKTGEEVGEKFLSLLRSRELRGGGGLTRKGQKGDLATKERRFSPKHKFTKRKKKGGK